MDVVLSRFVSEKRLAGRRSCGSLFVVALMVPAPFTVDLLIREEQ